MQNRVFSPDESAFTRNSLTNNRKASKPGQTTRLFALLTLLVIAFCATAEGASAQRPTTSLSGYQNLWNKGNPISALHDSQPRPDANCEGNPYVHESKPAPDRTKFRDYTLTIELSKQRKKNNEGGNTGNKGYQNNFDKRKGRYPERKAKNAQLGGGAFYATNAGVQIGGAPQQALPNAVSDMQGQMQGAGDAMQNGNCDALTAPGRQH